MVDPKSQDRLRQPALLTAFSPCILGNDSGTQIQDKNTEPVYVAGADEPIAMDVDDDVSQGLSCS